MLLSKNETSVREVMNLRPDSDGLMRTVGKPLLLPLSQRTPLGALTLGNSRRLVCSSGSNLYTHPANSAQGTPTAHGTLLPGAADCAVSLSDNRLLVMTASGSADVTTSGTQLSVSTAPEITGISITTADYGYLNETVGGFTLDEKEGEAAQRLEAAESKLLAMGKGAHARLHLQAANLGRYCSQVVCGFRLRNRRGDEIFRSQPFLLGHAGTVPVIELYSDDRLAIKPWQQSVNTWKMHLKVDASAALAATVGSLEVVALPQLHQVEPAQGGYAVLTRNDTVSRPFARLSITGGLGESYLNHRVAALSARLFSHGRVIHAITDPFNQGVDMDLNSDANPVYATDYSELTKALNASLPPVPSTLSVTMGLPHSFTARCGCRSGDTILWGDVTPVAYAGYPPQMLAATFGEAQSWNYAMQVVLSDGRRIYTTGTSTGPLPTGLNPLICYPHPDATDLRLRMSWSGGAWRKDFALRPSACGRFAYYLAADRAPIPVEANGGAVILNIGGTTARLSNLVIASHASTPTVASHCLEMPDGTVHAIVERPGNDTAWDHTRSRFFIGTRGGVHAIGVYINTDRPTHTLRRLSATGIRSRGALTAITEGAAALLDVPQGALPVVISKNGAVTPLCKPLGASKICYNPVARELLVHANGTTRVFCEGYSWKWYHRNDFSIQDVAQIDGLPYAITDAGVYSVAIEEPYGGTLPVALEADESTPKGALKRLNCARLTASGGDITMGLDLWRVEPQGSLKEPIVSYRLAGHLRRNPRLRLVSRPLRALRWCLAGEVDSSFIFKSLDFVFDEY